MVLQVKMFQGVPIQLKTIVALELWYPTGLGGLGVGPKVKVLEYLCGFSSVNTIDAQSLRYFLYQICPLHSKSECGKREAHIDWSMVIPVKAASVSGNTSKTTGPVPGDSRQ